VLDFVIGEEATLFWIKMIVNDGVEVLNTIIVSMRHGSWNPSIRIVIFMLLKITHMEETLLPAILGGTFSLSEMSWVKVELVQEDLLLVIFVLI